jgi:WD40 repeat protein
MKRSAWSGLIFIVIAPAMISMYLISHPIPSTTEAEAGTINIIRLSPDRRYLVVGGNRGVEMLRADTFEKIWFGEWPTTIQDVAISPQGDLLASLARDRSVILWNLKTGTQVETLKQPEEVSSYASSYCGNSPPCLAFSPNGDILAALIPETGLVLWNIRTMAVLEMPEHDINGFVWSPSGRRLAVMKYPFPVSIWEVSDRTVSARQSTPVFSQYPPRNGDIIWSPDGMLLAGLTSLGSSIGMVWNTQSHMELQRFPMDEAARGATNYQFAPDGKSLIVASITREQPHYHLSQWDLQTGRQVFRVNLAERVLWLHLSPNGETLATSSDTLEGVITLRNAHTGAVLGTLDDGSGSFYYRLRPVWVSDTLLMTDIYSQSEVLLWNTRWDAVTRRLVASKNWQRLTGPAEAIENDWGPGVWSSDGRFYAQQARGDTHKLAVLDTQKGRTTIIWGRYLWISFDKWSADSRYAVFYSSNQYGAGENIAFDTVKWEVAWVNGCSLSFCMSPCLAVLSADEVIAALEAGFEPTPFPIP